MPTFMVLFKDKNDEIIEYKYIPANNIVDIANKAESLSRELLCKEVTVKWEAFALMSKGNVSR